MKKIRFNRIPVTVTLLVMLLPAGQPRAQERHVDYAFSPARYLTAICFPADWQKTVVTETGTLAYDFGPGPYTRPLTEISIGVRGTDLSHGVPAIADPRVPVVTLDCEGGGDTVGVTEFCLAGTDRTPPVNTFMHGRIRRLGGLNGAPGWATPPPGCDPAFRNAAWGTNRPILYRVRVPVGSARRVALGFCEPYKGTRNQRLLELRVEGAPPMTIDALKDSVKNTPYVYLFDARDTNRDGEIAIEVHASPLGNDPNVILNAFWVFPAGSHITPEEVIAGGGAKSAEIAWSCGLENELGARASRIDGILARIAAPGAAAVVNVRTHRLLAFDAATGALVTDGRPFVIAHPRALSAEHDGETWRLVLPAGTREAQVYVLAGSDTRAAARRLPDLHGALREAVRYWKTSSDIPFGHITVPDSGIQYVLDASIRNFYQIAEQVDGLFQFQPGPSVYRGLWMHDEAWDVVTSLTLGDTASARKIMETALTYQLPNGQVFASEPFVMLRETPLTLYGLSRYAVATANAAWLRRRFASVCAAVNWIRATRMRTLADPASPTFGLFPPGFTDGGLGGLAAEYGTTVWSLSGLRWAARAAASAGEDDSARSWNRLAAELMESFRAAARRDCRRDSFGNLYLPMKVGDTSTSALPQQANWGMIDGEAFGHLFPPDDPLLNGTFAMLDSRMAEGIHMDVGWVKGGVWPFLTADEGIALAYMREYDRAEDFLYAVANHATPTGTWLEEQLPRSAGTRTGGDASDATASSLFILFLREMIAGEHGDTLEILGGVPAAWYAPGARIALSGVVTDFGPVSLECRVSPDGKLCTLTAGCARPADGATLRVVTGGLRDAGFVPEVGAAPGEALTAALGTTVKFEFRKR
ncbi:MAG TPA: hypothetical protein VL221_13435 [Bacteroidota bacterium]|nr:hypothetical protein [Bacteroidota bacterium]